MIGLVNGAYTTPLNMGTDGQLRRDQERGERLLGGLSNWHHIISNYTDGVSTYFSQFIIFFSSTIQSTRSVSLSCPFLPPMR